MSGYKKDYTMADDKIYNKYGKIVEMMDDLQSAGCFDTTYSQPVYRLVVTGPNGCGKDSFINAILGFPFLPPIKTSNGNSYFTFYRRCITYGSN